MEIIRARRYFRMALRVLLTNEVRSKLKQRSQYINLDPDASSDDVKDKSENYWEADFFKSSTSESGSEFAFKDKISDRASVYSMPKV